MDLRLLGEWAIGMLLATTVVRRLRGHARLSRWPRQDELERRIAELEENQPPFDAGEHAELARRVAELEERVDFAERVLAKQRDAERLGPPRA